MLSTKTHSRIEETFTQAGDGDEEFDTPFELTDALSTRNYLAEEGLAVSLFLALKTETSVFRRRSWCWKNRNRQSDCAAGQGASLSVCNVMSWIFIRNHEWNYSKQLLSIQNKAENWTVYFIMIF